MYIFFPAVSFSECKYNTGFLGNFWNCGDVGQGGFRKWMGRYVNGWLDLQVTQHQDKLTCSWNALYRHGSRTQEQTFSPPNHEDSP